MRAALHGIAVLAAFLAGFGGGCWGIGRRLPFPDVPIVTEKVEHFARHTGDYDTLFIGSSRIQYQVMPRLFDELTAAGGRSTRSFNAAVAGMHPVEDGYVFDRILEHPSTRLRWVFIELAALRIDLAKDKSGTVREVYWHDWPRLRLLWQRAWAPKPTNSQKKVRLGKRWVQLQEPLGHFFEHLRLFLQNTSHVGRGALLTDLLRSSPPAQKVRPPPEFDGWSKTGLPERMTGRALQDYERELAERRLAPARKDFADRASQEALRRMIGKVRSCGAEPVLIVPPTTAKRNFFPEPGIAKSVIVLDFSDLDRFPALYENEHRLDTGHLNTAGAEVFTRSLARRFLEAAAGIR